MMVDVVPKGGKKRGRRGEKKPEQKENLGAKDKRRYAQEGRTRALLTTLSGHSTAKVPAGPKQGEI